MKLTNLLQLSIFFMLLVPGTILAQGINCFGGLTISIRGSDAESAAICQGDGEADVIRFTAGRLIQPVGYVVVDENDIIVKATYRNIIDLEGLPTGNLRVYGFYYIGRVNDTVGQNLNEANLATGCFRLSENSFPISGIIPEGQSVATEDGLAAVYTCPGDGVADIVSFATTSTDPFYNYVITDENNLILAFVDGNSHDFDGAPEGTCRVWGVSSIGGINTDAVGEDIQTVLFSEDCFDLSDTYVEVIRTTPEGGTVSLTDGTDAAILCSNEETPDLLNFEMTTTSPAPYTFFLTDENNEIIQQLEGNTLDPSTLPNGVSRIWGLSYTGDLTFASEDDILSAALSDDCFDVSDNAIEITKKDPDGATVNLSDGAFGALVCINDGQADELSFTNTSTSTESYVYLVTNSIGIIEAIVEGDSFDFDASSAGTSLVWGLSYSGNLIAQVGDSAAEVILSDECYELSGNFVTVIKVQVEGGMVGLADGSTETTICVQDGVDDVLELTNTSQASESYAYIITDDNDNILNFSDSPAINLEGADPGICKIWGLSYSGSLMITTGENVTSALLSNECYDLSDNVVTVTRKSTEGGTVSLAGGDTETLVCVGDGVANELTFESTGAEGESFIFVITDDNNNILDLSESGVVDFDGAPEGVCRVWGLSYAGNIIADVGDNAAEVTLSDQCYDLSDNFVTITRISAEGGTVSLAGGGTEALVCVGDGVANELTFESTGAVGESFIFVVTDDNNNILSLSEDGVVDFEGAPEGVCRVWGLSYAGNIIAGEGDNAGEVTLTDECYDLSDNFVTVTRKSTEGGTVSIVGGDTEALVCVGDEVSDELTFESTGAAGESFIFVVTDDNNNILSLSEDGVVDFEGAPAGVCRVWGLSYAGNIIAGEGDNAGEVTLTDECYDLSDNFVTITRKSTEGGTVSIVGGATEALVCVGDGVSDELTFESAGAEGESFIFVVTDDSNNILSLSENGVVNFEDAPEGVCRVWGLSYSGNIIADVGDNAGEVTLTDECYDLSDNFVSITRESTEGGTVALEDGATEIFVCVGDGNSDFLNFVSSGSEGDNFIFVVTDDQDSILDFSLSGVVNFENAPEGVCRVWGLSFTGNRTAVVGDHAPTTVLSDGCFDLSDNFVTVDRRGLNGGTVSLMDGATEAVVCLDDITPDLLTFTTTATTNLSEYTYVVTDENNVIIAVSSEPEIDFSGADPGICRVWGLSYTGTLTAQPGDTATTTTLTNECFALSDNFVTVSRKDVDGGSISLLGGLTEKLVCSNDEASGLLVLNTTSTASAEYGYVITDTLNQVLISLNGNSINFGVADPGEYRIWGYSFTGNNLLESGSDAGLDPISDECYDLSENYVTIRLEQVDGGAVSLSSGDAFSYTCPADGSANTIEVTTTGSSDGSYVYILTDVSNIILAISETGIISPDPAGGGVNLVRGLAYTGNLTVQVGDDISDAAFSDGCFDLSENFITLIQEEPLGGTVSMPSGDTVRYTCPGDNLEDIVSFDSTGTSNTPYGYIITDEENVILAFAEGDQFDFNDAPLGICRVWGLAYIGDLLAIVGDDADEVDLASQCFDLSDNFIEIRRVAPTGGAISFDDGSESVDLCADTGESTIVRMTAQGTSTNPYVFLILEGNDDDLPMIVDIVEADSFDFAGLDEKDYQIRGLSYTGNLQLAAGGTFDETAALSDDCYSLSENILQVNTVQPDGGTISVEGFATNDVNICVGDGTPDSLIFVVNTGATAASSTKIITDGEGIFLTTLDEEFFNFENSSGGIFLVYHVSYTGNIALSPGDDINDTPVASGCAELSEPVVVNAQLVDGGRLLTTTNQTLLYVCANNGDQDIITVFNTSSATDASYKYMLVTGGVILSTQDEPEFNLTGTRFKSLEIWGVSYTGTFASDAVGKMVEDAVLSDGCYVLSDNPVQLFIDEAEGGVISAEGGATELSLCIGADESVVQFETSSGSSLGYVYVLTTGDDIIIRVIDGDSVNFSDLPIGLYRIHAVSYSGELTVTPTSIFSDDQNQLATSCFERSANFVEVIRFPAVSGGRIFVPGNSEGVVYSCPDNGVPDVVSLFETGNAPNDNYTYLITDGDNKIFIPSFTGNEIDFDPAPAMTYRIYGISYHGRLLTQFGTDVLVDMLADSCFELSENFITIINETPEAGTITTEADETTIDVTQGDEVADSVTFINAGASAQPYAYVVTDEENVIVAVEASGVFDFETLGSQNLRVWGLSYTGDIVAAIGDDADEVMLTSDCWDLTDDFVTVNISSGSQQAQVWETTDVNVTLNRIIAAPNPAMNWVNLRIEIVEPVQAESVIHIFNANGQLVYQNRLLHTDGLHQLELNTSSWRSGIYAVRVQNGGKVVTDRFVKQE